jgi:uncharacterized membrane protein HdeD (DUF308 family)
MAVEQGNFADIRRVFNLEMHQHWGLYMAEGAVLVVLGATAIVLPPLATLAVTILLGWLLLVSGIVGLVTTILRPALPGFIWSLLSAVLAIAVGGVLLANAEIAVVPLTLALLVFFMVEGFASIMYALDHRRQMSAGKWRWMMASGIFDLGLGGYIVMGLPAVPPGALGLLVGINMVFGGAALIAMAEHAHEADKKAHISP